MLRLALRLFFVDNAPYGICRSTIGHGGKFVAVNPALTKMFGYDSAQEMLALNLEKDVYLDPSERHVLTALLKSQGSYNNLELHWRTKAGKELVIRSSGRLVRAVGSSEFIESISGRRYGAPLAGAAASPSTEDGGDRAISRRYRA
jgi:PAS domain S-box-containing protein